MRRRVQAAVGGSLRIRLLVVGLVTAIVVGVGAWSPAAHGARTTADEPHYLLTALSVWEDWSLDYGDERAATRYWDYHALVLPTQARFLQDGRRVAPHEPLLPLMLAPAVGVGGWLGAKLFMAGLAGLLASLLTWTLERRFGLTKMWSGATAVLVGCSPPLAVYGTQIYPELPAALLVLASYAALTRPSPLVPADVAVLAAASALPWLNVKYAPVAVVLMATVLVRHLGRRSRRALQVDAVLLAAAGGLWVVVHRAVYGGLTAYAVGSHFAGGEMTVMGERPDYADRTVRLTGLLLDRSFGLAAWQPALLLGLPCLACWVARRRSLPCPWVLVGMVGAGWATATWAALTMHGWWWPGRQAVIVVPLLALQAAVVVSTWRPALRRAAAVVASTGAWMYGWLTCGALSGAHTLIIDFDRTTDPLGRVWRAMLPDLRVDRPLDTLLFSMWTIGLLAVSAGSFAVARRRRPAPAGEPNDQGATTVDVRAVPA